MMRYYDVAGHKFSISIPDGIRLWDYLDQYAPFATASGEESLFDVEMSPRTSDIAAAGDTTMHTVYDTPPEKGETLIRLYALGDGGWLFEMAMDSEHPIAGRLRCNADFSKGVLYLSDRKIRNAVFCINNSAMLLYAFVTAGLGTLQMHASVVSNSGKAYLFLAKSGTGKSTHSQLWLDNVPGSELVNDDNPIVRVGNDGTVTVYGSPWSGKTPCYRNVSFPVGAFVNIKRCSENRIVRISSVEAYAAVYSSCSGFKADEKMSDGLHDTINRIVMNCSHFNLFCRPDREAAVICHSGVSAV